MAGVDSSGSGSSQTTDGAGTATGLISMADYFLSLEPQRIYEAVQCLMGALALTPPPRIEARARLQLGMVLYRHTCNLVEAREHLDKAVSARACIYVCMCDWHLCVFCLSCVTVDCVQYIHICVYDALCEFCRI